MRAATAGLNTSYGGAGRTTASGGTFDGWSSSGLLNFTGLKFTQQTMIILKQGNAFHRECKSFCPRECFSLFLRKVKERC